MPRKEGFGGGRSPSGDREGWGESRTSGYADKLLERIEYSFSHEPFTEDDLREMFGFTGPQPESGAITARIGPKILDNLVNRGFLEFDENSGQYTLIRTREDIKRGFESLSTDSDEVIEEDDLT